MVRASVLRAGRPLLHSNYCLKPCNVLSSQQKQGRRRRRETPAVYENRKSCKNQLLKKETYGYLPSNLPRWKISQTQLAQDLHSFIWSLTGSSIHFLSVPFLLDHTPSPLTIPVQTIDFNSHSNLCTLYTLQWSSSFACSPWWRYLEACFSSRALDPPLDLRGFPRPDNIPDNCLLDHHRHHDAATQMCSADLPSPIPFVSEPGDNTLLVTSNTFFIRP